MLQNNPQNPASQKVPFWKSLGRSQVSSLAATVLDFSVLFLCVEILGVWYPVATGIGALSGAILNFTMGRRWSFEANTREWSDQALRYAYVSLASLGLNVVGVYVITEYLGITYGYSRGITAFVIGLCFNFPLHRHYVFRVEQRK